MRAFELRMERGRTLSLSVEGYPEMPPEFYLIIFLMVVMLIYVYFYGERAQKRRAKSQHDETSTNTDVTQS